MKKYFNYNFFTKNSISLDQKGSIKNVSFSPFFIKTFNIKKRRNFIEQVKTFLEVMNDRCAFFDITRFQENISKMRFKFYNKENKKTGIVIFLKNKCKIHDMEAILHELIHIATIKVNGHIEYCGFSINNYLNGESFCQGLNEGYTQIIKERYFGKDSKVTYPIEVEIAKKIEILIGKEKMESLFFNINFNGLNEEIKKYCLESDFYRFIWNLDYINQNFPPKNSDDMTPQMRMTEIYMFIFRCFQKKIEQELNNEELIVELETLFSHPKTYYYQTDKSYTIKGLDKSILDEYQHTKTKKR